MGCDIHAFIEYKSDEDNTWRSHPKHKERDEDGYSTDLACIGRDYELFNKLAGVRGYRDGPSPKGIPNDVSSVVKAEIDKWESDGHSHSYISLDDFNELVKDYPQSTSTNVFDWRDRNNFGNSTSVKNVCYKFAEEISIDYILLNKEPPKLDFRLVFFFDS